MTTRKQEETLGKIRSLMLDCTAYDDSASEQNAREALNYYFQRKRGDEVDGRSDVVSGDISSMTEANLSQMLDSFTGDNVAQYDATGETDDDQAQLESAVITKFVMKDNNGYWEIGSACKEALVLRNGFVHMYVENDEKTYSEELINATPETLAVIERRPGVTGFEVVKWEGPVKGPARATIRITTTTRRFVCEALPKEHFGYLKNWKRVDLQRIPFCFIRHREARSELLRRGFPKSKVNKLKPFEQDAMVSTGARAPGGSEEQELYKTALDRSQELIEWYECFVLMDSGDGRSERRRISVGGVNANSLLEDVPFSHVPVVTGTAFINPHRLTSISLFDKLKQQQDKTTGLERALMDNINGALKNRTAYLEGRVDVDALDDGRINSDLPVTGTNDVRSAIMNFSQPDLTQGILSNLQHQDTKRSELGGAALDLASGNAQLSGGRIGSEGMDRAYSVMEQLAAHMTKNMARSLIRGMYLLAHLIVREYWDTPVSVKVNGKWKTAVPREWEPRTAVTVNIGMSPGERARMVTALKEIVADQVQLAREGQDEILVNAETFYRARTDLARMQELPTPEQYFLDPATESSRAAAKRKADERALQRDANVALMREAVGIERLKVSLDKYQSDQSNVTDVLKILIDAQIAEAELTAPHIADLLKQARGQLNGQSDTGNRTDAGDASPNGRGNGNASELA